MSRHYRYADVILQVFGNSRLAKDNGKLKPVDELVIEQKTLVYCEDCINNTRNVDGVNENWCLYFGYEVEDDDFCSRGER